MSRKSVMLALFSLLFTLNGPFLATSRADGVQIQKTLEKKYATGSLVNLMVQSPETDYPMRSLFIWTPPVDSSTIDNLPVVYFLHGWPGSPLAMITSITPVLAKQFAAGSAPFIAVFPDGNAKTHIDSEWADSSDGKAKIETWLTTNAITAVEGDHVRPKEKRAIVGFSMGGYGAGIIALHHPDLYTQVTTLAGYFVVDDLTRAFVGADKIAYQNPNNFMKVASNFRWFLAEARDDFSRPIRGEMVRWSTNLKKLKISVVTQAPTGGHSFTFVAGQIPLVVKWFNWPT